jgi:Ion channel
VTESGPTARHRARYGLLLGAIVLAFGVQGIAQPGGLEQVFTSALLGITLLLALWAADPKPRFMRPAAVVVAVVFILSVVEAINGNVDDAATRISNALLVFLAPPAIVVGVLRSMRASKAVTVEAVFGVLCVYLLLGMFFSFTYGTIDHAGGSPFFAGGQPATISLCLYYSFTTLTTVGYGDLTARSNLGHTLSTLEALLGQIYLITVVSLLVSNLRPRSRPASPRAAGEAQEPG